MRGRRVLTIVACTTAFGAVAAGSVHAAGAPSRQAALPPASPSEAVQLSDERLVTRWAYPERRALVYSRPSGKSRTVGRLHLLTEDEFPELYLALSRWTDAQGNRWIRIRVPKRPNGVKGWVRADALGALNVSHRLIEVNKRTLRLTVFDRGKVIMSARVGVGKAGTTTPSGRFYVREKFHVKGVPLYGPRAIGTSAYAPTLSDWPGGGVVGLHGTNQPGLIPGRPSHGCIRLKNRDILRLYRLAERGTPIHIH